MADQVEELLNSPDVDPFEALVGDGKRYKTPQELAKAKLHADKHIKDVESERALDREQIQLLAKILETRQNDNDDDEVVTTTQGTQSVTPDIEKTVEEVLERRASEAKVIENKSKSNAMLVKQYDSAEKAAGSLRTFYELHPELQNEMEYLRANNPDAFMKLYNSYNTPGTQPANTAPGTHGRSSADAIKSTGSGLTWDKAMVLRKENPKEYNSEEFQAKLRKAIEDGELEIEDYEGKPS